MKLPEQVFLNLESYKELPADIDSYEIAKCVTVSSNDLDMLIRVSPVFEVPLPLALIPQSGLPDSASIAGMVMERVLLDISVDLYPLIERRVRDALSQR